MRTAALCLTLTALLCGTAHGQVAREIEREYHARMMVADSDSAVSEDQVRAAEAARLMRRFDEARFYLERAEVSAGTEGDRNGILFERLWLELASGGGVEGVQRVFADARSRREIVPVVLAGWVNAFPELLVGGQFDAVIGSLSADAEDESLRCTCYAPKAWMHRAANRMELSRIYWDSLNATQRSAPDFAHAFDEADWRAQLARNLARAGRLDESRAELERAMAVDVSAFESVTIRRRRAQTWAELGEVEKAVADLEYLLSVPSPVTVHTLRSRLTWKIVRDHPAFQALLRKHGGHGGGLR